MKDDSDTPVEIDLEYDESEDINEPACQEMNASVTAELWFGGTTDLTESSNLCVNSQYSTVDFEESDAYSVESWESDGHDLTSTSTLNEVHKYDGNFNLYWYYMVPSADDTVWVYMGSTSHTVYLVRAQPFRDMALPWQKVLDYSCVWAQGNFRRDLGQDRRPECDRHEVLGRHAPAAGGRHDEVASQEQGRKLRRVGPFL